MCIENIKYINIYVKKEQQWPTSETQASSETELQCFTCRVDTCPLKKHPMNWKRWIDDSWDRWLIMILYGKNPSLSNCPKCIRMILNIIGDGYATTWFPWNHGLSEMKHAHLLITILSTTVSDEKTQTSPVKTKTHQCIYIYIYQPLDHSVAMSSPRPQGMRPIIKGHPPVPMVKYAHWHW